MKSMLETVSYHIREIGGRGSRITFFLPMSLWDFQNYKVKAFLSLMEGFALEGPYNNDKIVLHHWKRRGLNKK